MSRRPGSWTLALLACFTLASSQLSAQQVPETPQLDDERRILAAMHGISSNTILDWVNEMCAPRYRGRLTGTPEYQAIAEWAARLLAGWKVAPAGDGGTYFQWFPNPYTLVMPGSELTLDIPGAEGRTIRKNYVLERDYFPGSTSASGSVTAEVYYVGYGVTAPELGYDDYAGVDVSGKIVMMDPEVPVGPGPDADLFRRWRPYSFHDYKMKNAQAHGAVGMAYNYHIANPNSAYLPGFIVSYVSRDVAEDVFAGTGRSYRAVVSGIRKDLKPASFATGRTMTIKNVTDHHPEGMGSNVIGWIEGVDPALKHEAIIIGAHLDHVGLNPELMPGAHDNASGVAVTLGAAQALATSGVPLKRSVVFVLFGAEEQGVRGSEHYVTHPFIPNAQVRAMLNMESVGRGERISVGGARNSPALFEPFERLNSRYIHRQISGVFTANLARPRQDAAHFMWAGVPTLSFGVAGATALPFATYHTSKDVPSLLTPEIIEDLARLTFLATVELANGQQ